MTREEIISGLKLTVDMFLFDPSTGEALTEPRNDLDKITIDACTGAIELLQQEPKTGHWIELGCVGNDNYDFECSECHHTDTHSKTVKVNYCWCCGIKMVELQESEEKNDTD